MSDAQDEKYWHLDKKVPLAIIISIVIQTAGLVWFVAKLDSRITLVEGRTEAFWRERDSNRDRLLVLEQQSRTILDAVRRIENRLDPTRRSDAGP